MDEIVKSPIDVFAETPRKIKRYQPAEGVVKVKLRALLCVLTSTSVFMLRTSIVPLFLDCTVYVPFGKRMYHAGQNPDGGYKEL